MTETDKLIALLEEIAFSCKDRFIEKDEFLRRLYASCKPETAEIHGNVFPQRPSAGKLPEPESGRGVLAQAGRRVQEEGAQTQDDNVTWVKRYKGGKGK